MSELYLVGLGPGDRENMTGAALQALEKADILCGYTVYVDLVRQWYPDKETFTTPMTREMDRCRWAVKTAAAGRSVAMLCSGDAGIYGMAGPVMELAAEEPQVEIIPVPGITAAVAGAAVLGAPLMNDFAVISLSDRLTPPAVIEKRLHGAGMGNFVVCLYNPASRQRATKLREACDILLRYRAEDTLCGWVRCIGREGQDQGLLTLSALREAQVDMFTTVYIGTEATHKAGRWMVTRRGYKDGPGAGHDRSILPDPEQTGRYNKIILFGGTTEGRLLAERLAAAGYDMTVSVATQQGAQELRHIPDVHVLTGRIPAGELPVCLSGYDLCIDATHPYAQEISQGLQSACEELGLPLRRVLRQASEVPENAVCVPSPAAAAEYLEKTSGNILLTTGAKELPFFAPLDPERLYVRILPVSGGLAACEKAGIPSGHVIAMQGPFSEELNTAILRQYGIRYLVTKDGGSAGGFREKAAAADRAGTQMILITRPAGTGIPMEALLRELISGE